MGNKKYFISLLTKDCKGIMCVGYVDDFKTAENILKANVGNIWNTGAKYAVIEEVREGLFMYDEQPKFYVKLGVESVKLLKNPPRHLPKNRRIAVGFGIKIGDK